MAKKIKRRVNKAALALRKQFNADQKQLEIDSHVIINHEAMKKKIPNRKKRKEYIKALISDFDEKLK